MSCYKFSAIDTNRWQIQYPLVRSKKGNMLVSDSPVEIMYKVLDISESDSLTLVFDSPFVSIPKVIAGFVSLTASVGNVNVYVETVSKTGCTIRTSSAVTGKIAVHAINLG